VIKYWRISIGNFIILSSCVEMGGADLVEKWISIQYCCIAGVTFSHDHDSKKWTLDSSGSYRGTSAYLSNDNR